MIFTTEQHDDYILLKCFTDQDSLLKTCWTTIFVRLDQLLNMPARCGMAGLHYLSQPYWKQFREELSESSTEMKIVAQLY